MIEIYAVSMVVGFIIVIGVVIGTTLWLRFDIAVAKSELKSYIKSIDESQRRMENDISFIKGALCQWLSRDSIRGRSS